MELVAMAWQLKADLLTLGTENAALRDRVRELEAEPTDWLRNRVNELEEKVVKLRTELRASKLGRDFQP